MSLIKRKKVVAVEVGGTTRGKSGFQDDPTRRRQERHKPPGQALVCDRSAGQILALLKGLRDGKIWLKSSDGYLTGDRTEDQVGTPCSGEIRNQMLDGRADSFRPNGHGSL